MELKRVTVSVVIALGSCAAALAPACGSSPATPFTGPEPDASTGGTGASRNASGGSSGAGAPGSGGVAESGGSPAAGGRDVASTGGLGTGVAGTGGIIGVAGSRGTGGSTAPGSSSLGGRCIGDLDCTNGLTCVSASSHTLLSGGPAGGLCTHACSQDTDCQSQDPSAACVNFDPTSQVGVCLPGCVPGPSVAEKCLGRGDMACDSRGFCAPTCAGDFDCGTRKCNLGTGLCVDQITGTLPLGSACTPATMPDQCEGVCRTLIAGDNSQISLCSGRCQLGAGAGCGFDVTASVPGAFCLFAPAGADVGDLGTCGQLCDCNTDCRDPSLVCVSDANLAAATGRAGYCTSPNRGDGSVDPGISCP